MSSEKNQICHNGVIQNIDEKYIYVMIVAKSACSACHSQAMCSMTEMKEKIIEINKEAYSNYKIGDQVEIIMNQSMGTKAVFLGYFLPFIFMMITMLTTFSISKNEALTALFTIMILAIYYLLLFVFKKQISNTFSFKIQ
jgi:sigma-E factor negative regulatory protein RseC